MTKEAYLSSLVPRMYKSEFDDKAAEILAEHCPEALDSYGPKFVENIVQATSRDILCYAMKTLRCCSIVMHIHDELVIEADPRMSLDAVCEQMGRTPPWAKGLQLRADGYETEFYKKD